MDTPTPVHGHCTAAFEPLQRQFATLFESGADLGASLAVTIDGEPLVDLWGGWADPERTRPWERDTITHVWSTTKTMTSLAALLLVDRGELVLDAPVARYWPAFGANGKGGITLRHLLTHSSGVSGWAEPVTLDDVCDWDKSTSLLAAQAPWWTPGSASGYHALNYGHLIGEVIRRVTGQRTGAFFAEQIARPLDADFHIGLADAEFHRVANVVPPPPLPIDLNALDPASPMVRTLANPTLDASVSWSPTWRGADIGAANGHGNARSVAQVQSALACGGEAGGLRLLSQSTLDEVFRPQVEGPDLVIGMPLTLGLGYGLPHPVLTPFLPGGRIAFWGGWGGSMVLADADRRMCFAYMMNRMAPGLVGGPNVASLVATTYRILERSRVNS